MFIRSNSTAFKILFRRTNLIAPHDCTSQEIDGISLSLALSFERFSGDILINRPLNYGSPIPPMASQVLPAIGIPLACGFNMSHASNLAVYAIARNREVGIDVERIEPKWAVGEIANKFFARNEIAKLHSLQESIGPEAFFHCWTRKEAYVKARGAGLQIALDSFEVSLAPGEQPRFLSKGEFGWSLKAIPLDRDYVAAIAVEGHDWRPRFLEWQIRPAGHEMPVARGRACRDCYRAGKSLEEEEPKMRR